MRFLQGPPCILKHTEANCSTNAIHQRGPKGNLEEQNPQLFSFLQCFAAKERTGPRPAGTPSPRDPQTPLRPGVPSPSRPMLSRWTRGRTQAANAPNVSPTSRQRADHRGIPGRFPRTCRPCSNVDEPAAPRRVSRATCPRRTFGEIPSDRFGDGGAWPARTARRS